MKDSIKLKLETLCDRFEEIAGLLAVPEIINDQNKFRDLSKEYSSLEPVVKQFNNHMSLLGDKEAAEEMLKDSDPDIREMGKEELNEIAQNLDKGELELQKLLIPKDPHDDSNIFLEIRAGTGGDEAAIFSGDLFKMYSRYFDSRGWRVEVLSENEGDHGGYKEIISRVVGNGAYSQLKFESGAHRVQRVPKTESQGRVHTSAATVAVIPQYEEEDIDINKADLRTDTFRASGAGGQHVNKTESGVRFTHLPTGIAAESTESRSQIKNRGIAMTRLIQKIKEVTQAKIHQEQKSQRQSLVGSGDRSDKIRTYNYPQNRLTDHRINLTLYSLDKVVQGQIEEIIDALVVFENAEKMKLGS